jgi:dipeptidyl aminopeptidase/acylaminoacyl peptidase
MKSIIFFLGLLNFAIVLSAQSVNRKDIKPVLDSTVFDKWLGVQQPVISNNGQYLSYVINNPNSSYDKKIMVIQSTHGTWKRVVEDAVSSKFTEDSKHAIYLQGSNNLCLLVLGDTIIEKIPGVHGFKLFRMDGEDWLAYQLSNPSKELILRKLSSGREHSFSGVLGYVVEEKGQILVLRKEVGIDNKSGQCLEWITLTDGKGKTIWKGLKSANPSFNDSGNKIAFTTETSAGLKEVWTYEKGNENAEMMVNDTSAGIEKDQQIRGLNCWGKNDKIIFIDLIQRAAPKPSQDAVMVNILSYNDANAALHPYSYLGKVPPSPEPQKYVAAINTSTHQIINFSAYGNSLRYNRGNEYAIIEGRKGDWEEYFWNPKAIDSFKLFSTISGELYQINQLKNISLSQSGISLSPLGNYVIGMATSDWNWYSYDPMTKAVVNLTSSIPGRPDNEFVDRMPERKYKWLVPIGWTSNGQDLLLCDFYDIWKIDLSGKNSPINLTEGYGAQNRISFQLLGPDNQIVSSNSPLIVHAFNMVNKEAGFYQIKLNRPSIPQKLLMGPYSFDNSDPITLVPGFRNSNTLVKARDTNLFILARNTSCTSPNYYITSDFETFNLVSNVYPERNWNWMTNELLSWKAFDGHPELGILYKPENFDPHKKYPVIIHYYEIKSMELFKYKIPGPTEDMLNIPWFVSHGYLVFVPDIFYTRGDPGAGTYNSVVSGAKMLMKFPWVDAKKIGIQGHSWGSTQTNYLVAHTDIFAAAVSSCGTTDMISDYSAWPIWVEAPGQQGRMATYPSGNISTYIKNSAVLFANKVSTPLLLMYNRSDAGNYYQGAEFYTGLRRLQKRVWMLQYDEGSHGVFGKDAIDYTYRIEQFFDHYLKDSACPRWMLYGVTAKDKGIDDGLQLVYEKDKNGKWLTPKDGGLLTDEEKKKVEKLKNRKSITITLE